MSSSAYSDLRLQAPRLALALLFQTDAQKQCLSTLLLLGLEFDRIVAQASEPMLALIRLNWWEDQLETKTDEMAPLASYLLQQLATKTLTTTEVSDLITCWVQTVQAGQTDTSENWGELVSLMAKAAGIHQPDLPQQIGRGISCSRTGQPVGALLSAKQIHQLCGKGCEFLICFAYLATAAEKRDLNAAPFLIFELLRQVLFRPASR